MFEETNQTESYENMFDEAAEETGETTQPAEAAEGQGNGREASREGPLGGEADVQEAAGERQAKEESPATFKVKYMGQEMEMTADQLVVNAQKGMDYDRIRQERDALKNAPELQILDQYAKENGMTRQQLVEYLRKQRDAQEVQAQVQRGVPEEVAKQVMELRRKEAEREEKEAREQAANAERQRYAEFIREYPEVRDFPAEVKAAIEGGDTPLNAYRAWENRQLKLKIAAMEQAKKNAGKAVGPVTGDAPPEASDEFLSGFEAAFK